MLQPSSSARSATLSTNRAHSSRTPAGIFAFPLILLLLLGLLIGLVLWLASMDTEVPVQRIEQDVTNEALAG
jgi:hypothetical protein